MLAAFPASGTFVDYLTLLLISMAGGLFVLAAYWWKGMDAEFHRPWAPAFGQPFRSFAPFLSKSRRLASRLSTSKQRWLIAPFCARTTLCIGSHPFPSAK